MAKTSTKLLTAEEYALLPDTGERTELVAGVVVPVMRPYAAHGSVVSRLLTILGEHVYPNALGELFTESGFVVRRGPDTVRGPDVAFVAAERLPPDGLDGFLEPAPDLAVEVLSSSNRPREVRKKLAEYLQAGARLVWVVDPRTRTVTVHQSDGAPRVLREDDELDGGSVLPGFRCPVASLFLGLRRR